VTKVKLLVKTEILGISQKKGDIIDVGGVYADKLVDKKIATYNLEQSEPISTQKIEIDNAKPSE